MTRGPRPRPLIPRIALASLLLSGPLLASTAYAAELPAPLGACTGPDCPGDEPAPHNGNFAGRDASLNVFVGGDYQVQGRAAEVEGKVVALGDLTIDKSQGGVFNMGVAGVGSRIVPPSGTDFVTVGGTATVKDDNKLIIGGSDSRGQTAYGNLRYGTAATGKMEITPTGRAVQDDAAGDSFKPLRSTIEKASTCAARATANGTVDISGNEATFTGDGTSSRQVFDVKGDLGGKSPVGLAFHDIPAGATVVVNMLSPDATINTYTGSGMADDPMTKLRSKLLWNFPTATRAAITGSAQFQGSVMAGNPDGTVTLSTPGLNGRVYVAGNLVQEGTSGSEIHQYSFDGDLPECDGPAPTSTPAPTATPSATAPATPATPDGPGPSTSPSPGPSAPTRQPQPSSTSTSTTSGTKTDGPGPAAPTSPSTPGGGRLAHTGAGLIAPVTGVAVLLLGAGGAVYAITRRRARRDG
ncbi:choice-of-anchor A family protein [Streptomyces atriruber]|uniref:Choice-of-anchor A family protein n=1 Tax=Streptomyces atriruber TaxID=545121 RepID=A0ABV3BI49_9ACTN